ncbi:MAG: hypothetical protein ACI4I9_02305 [Porcipelethomonas sp.]
MADMIRSTVPITNKNIVQPLREHKNADIAPFDVTDPSRIVKTVPDSEILKQNTGNIDKQTAPEILMDLLKDPSVTVNFIKNITMLQEIIGVISMQNAPVTEEIEQLFSQLVVEPENLAEELILQENSSTAFKGELFDFLRNMIKGDEENTANSRNFSNKGLFFNRESNSGSQNAALNNGGVSKGTVLKGNVLNSQNSVNTENIQSSEKNVRIALSPELKTAVINVLKAVNTESSKSEILKALSGTMKYLSETLAPNKELSAKLTDLSQRFRAPDADKEFAQLKSDTAAVMQEVEKSIMFSSKLSCLSSMITYNLSRYNTNEDFLSDAARNLMVFIPEEEQRTEFLQKLYTCLTGRDESAERGSNSKVLDVLVKILEKHTENEKIMQMKGESVENVIHSLLSSPSNFTPLLHFIIPVDDGESKAFGEMWINPDEEEKKKGSSGEIEISHNIHMLLVFDIPDIGRFETELYVRDKKIDLSIMCPEIMEEKEGEISSEIRKCIEFSEYSFDNIRVGKLERSRSLVEVFPTLPQKRTGINVRI